MSFIIQDWAGNMIDYDGKLERPSLAVPMEFKSFEDGWEFLYERFADLEGDELDEELGEFYVVPKPARNFGLQ